MYMYVILCKVMYQNEYHSCEWSSVIIGLVLSAVLPTPWICYCGHAAVLVMHFLKGISLGQPHQGQLHMCSVFSICHPQHILMLCHPIQTMSHFIIIQIKNAPAWCMKGVSWDSPITTCSIGTVQPPTIAAIFATCSGTYTYISVVISSWVILEVMP